MFPSPPLLWASPTDMSGSYGETKVRCQRIDFGPPLGRKFSDWRAWAKVIEILGEL